MLRGVRGAIQVSKNDSDTLIDASENLMRSIIQSNEVEKEKVAAVFFTVTPDLNAAFPAAVRSRIGWELVPFLCGQEIPVEAAPTGILRVLVLFETEKSQEEICHQYLGGAASLRPDLKSETTDKHT
jgi:chorismate mutase